MVSVMDSDFDVEKDKLWVSNEGINGDELDLNEEIRVSSDLDAQKECNLSGEMGDDKVLGCYHVNGDNGEVDEVRVLSDDGEIGVKDENLESRNFELGENDMGKLETSREMSGEVGKGENEMDELETSIEKSREIEKGENEMDDPVASGSGRKGKLISSSTGDFGEENENEGSRRGSIKGERDFKSRRWGDLGAPMSKKSKKFLGVDIDGSVMRSVRAEVLGTEFEMGNMVWGKVKSHPWWPGHLYNEAFASSSVRRARRDGHILVAFFGDSSYGWFEPDELVPYDPHYAEKSQQTPSRNFLRAVEESVDEAGRRSALGLSCYCRNPNNFRPTEVPGYLSADIVDYEPGTVYSVSQIQKARNSFHPAETLSFIHMLAAAPMGIDSSKSLDSIKNKAVALAYRRSVFEEFDATYAEAFGHKPERPKFPIGSFKVPSRAPLSGPLVFADTLGGRKSSTKAIKPKDQTKKDRYLLKRRDESNDPRTTKINQSIASPSSCSAHDDGTSDSTTCCYLFQKRDQPSSSNDVAESPAVDQLATSHYALTSEDIPFTGSNLTSVLQHKESETGDLPRLSDETIRVPTSSDTSNLATSGSLLKKKKKTKTAKRPALELSTEKPDPQEKKGKKLKKLEKDSHSARIGGASPVNPLERHIQVVASVRDDAQVGLVPLEGCWENKVDVRQVLSDLNGLALHPLHGAVRNVPNIARQFLLKFRSRVFLKSSSASVIGESEHGEVADRLPAKKSKPLPSLKPPKPSVKQNGSTKVDGKRKLSERQEESAAKKVEKVTDVKSLTAEKRAFLKNPESERSDVKSKDVAAAKSPQSKPVKKAERSARVEEPTYLVMKYPTGSSLPSLMELKAKFARFGPMDASLNRVFYRTDTCRVAFLYKQDANVAYRYAVGNKSVFANVRFLLKPMAESESQQPNIVKTGPISNMDRSSVKSRPATLAVQPQLKSILKKPSAGDESGVATNGGGGSRMARVRFNVGEEKSSASNRGGGTEVQLMESRNHVLSSQEGALLSSSSSSSSVAMDVNKNQRLISSKPLEPLLPFPQFVSPSFNHPVIAPRNNFHESVIAAATSMSGASLVVPPPPLPPPHSDISQEMMSLLTRCYDVVTNITSVLGYMPYHSL